MKMSKDEIYTKILEDSKKGCLDKPSCPFRKSSFKEWEKIMEEIKLKHKAS